MSIRGVIALYPPTDMHWSWAHPGSSWIIDTSGTLRDLLGGSPAEATPAERAVLPALAAHRLIAGAGHFLPREKPEAVSSAVLELLR